MNIALEKVKVYRMQYDETIQFEVVNQWENMMHMKKIS